MVMVLRVETKNDLGTGVGFQAQKVLGAGPCRSARRTPLSQLIIVDGLFQTI